LRCIRRDKTKMLKILFEMRPKRSMSTSQDSQDPDIKNEIIPRLKVFPQQFP